MKNAGERSIVVHGVGELAQLAHCYFVRRGGRHVAGFAVDAEFAQTDQYLGLPVVAAEAVEARFPPQDHDLFFAIGYSRLNAARSDVCARWQARGYRLASHVSPRAVVWPDFEPGANSLIMEACVIQPFATVGDGLIMFCAAVITHQVRLGHHCFVGAQATICGGASVGDRSFVGAGAIVREHLSIGIDCLIGAGARILKDAPDGTGYLASATPDSGIPSRRLQALL